MVPPDATPFTSRLLNKTWRWHGPEGPRVLLQLRRHEVMLHDYILTPDHFSLIEAIGEDRPVKTTGSSVSRHGRLALHLPHPDGNSWFDVQIGRLILFHGMVKDYEAGVRSEPPQETGWEAINVSGDPFDLTKFDAWPAASKDARRQSPDTATIVRWRLKMVAEGKPVDTLWDGSLAKPNRKLPWWRKRG